MAASRLTFSRAVVTAILSSLILLPQVTDADETLQLIATIEIERDSTKISSVTPVGDFNADGYEDLLIGLYQEPMNLYEAAYLYYGGPDFDCQPDLVFMGDPQNETLCDHPLDLPTAYAQEAAGLGDFNHDGYDDLAISAMAQCEEYVPHNGRVYIYFGSPNPDTASDIIIDGEWPYDGFGESLVAGDFNGDSSFDLLTNSIDLYWGQRVYVFFGGQNPDGEYDFLYDYRRTEVQVYGFQGGYDINGDGFDDYSWWRYTEQFWGTVVFLGRDPLHDTPIGSVPFTELSFPGDVSLDGIDDMICPLEDGSYLCLGGEPLDLEPDYYMWHDGGLASTYSLNESCQKLVKHQSNIGSFIMYNLGVPFDTIPYAAFQYNDHHAIGSPYIGDINCDGVDDLALTDSLNTHINIYSIFQTGVHGPEDHENVPVSHLILYCYPNPFNSSTTINLRSSTDKGGDVSIDICNLLGERVRSLSVDIRMEGTSRTRWDATDNSGRKVSSGIYFARVRGAPGYSTIKLIYLR